MQIIRYANYIKFMNRNVGTFIRYANYIKFMNRNVGTLKENFTEIMGRSMISMPVTD